MKKPVCIDRVPIELIPRTEFTYPEDFDDGDKNRVSDFIHTLLIELVKSKSPKTYLLALAYIYKINLEEVITSGDGKDKQYQSMEKLAAYHGIRKQSLSGVIERIRKKHSNQQSAPPPH